MPYMQILHCLCTCTLGTARGPALSGYRPKGQLSSAHLSLGWCSQEGSLGFRCKQPCKTECMHGHGPQCTPLCPPYPPHPSRCRHPSVSVPALEGDRVIAVLRSLSVHIQQCTHTLTHHTVAIHTHHTHHIAYSPCTPTIHPLPDSTHTHHIIYITHTHT